MENDSKYQAYAKDLIRSIPQEHLEYLIALFMQEAAINMGCAVDEKTLERTIYHIKRDFSYIPVCYIASAFIRGSLGKLPYEVGTTKLVPKTIHYWLGQITIEYNRNRAHQANKAPDFSNVADLHKFPAGRAICLKIDWYNSGLINSDDWDNIPLKELAGMIGRGEMPTTKDFGIKNT